MFDLILENKAGNRLTFGPGTPFTIIAIEGLNPPDATINTNKTALLDGEKFNSSKVNMRILNIAFVIEENPAENRLKIYKVLKSKQYVKVYFKTDERDVYIEGYVNSMPIGYFEMKQTVTVSIVCPQPYWRDMETIINDLNIIVPNFHSPFYSTAEPMIVFSYISNTPSVTVENKGDIDTGMIIELYAKNAISNPKIYNYDTQEYIGLSFDMQPLDLIRIDTREQHKTAVLIRSGIELSVFNSVIQGSTWLQLPAEGATFVYEVETGLTADLNVSFNHQNLFEGV